MTSLVRRWSRRTAAARVLPRAAAVSLTSALALLLAAGPAFADAATIPLKDDHKNTKAAEFGPSECDEPGGQLPAIPGHDGWHFVLPAKGTDATFVSVTLTFEDLDGAEVEKAATVGNPTDKHAVLHTPEGWTLLDGSAEIEGQENGEPAEFNLSHVCVNKDEPTEEPTEVPTDEPTEEPTEAPTDEPTEEPSEEPVDEEPSEAPSSPAPGNGGGLPVTGLALTGLIITGAGMVGAGVAMRALRRKKDDAAETEDGDEPTNV